MRAKGGESWHQFHVAWDVVPIVFSKPVWDAADPLWQEVITLGIEAGAEAGAHWKHFRDMPHFQFTPSGLTLVQAQERFASTGSIFV